MTAPIKPPGSPVGLPPTEGPASVDSTSGPDAFRRVLESNRTTVGEAGHAAVPSASHPIANIQADLRAGRIDLPEAIDRLVEHTAQKASGLTGAGRSELEARVREALLEDPTLAGLVRELQRSG